MMVLTFEGFASFRFTPFLCKKYFQPLTKCVFLLIGFFLYECMNQVSKYGFFFSLERIASVVTVLAADGFLVIQLPERHQEI